MGVRGLWQLLLPTGRRISIETLSGKVLAVDASIWLTQFLKANRDPETGAVRANAHLIGFFRRIAKLLFHGIRPILVFDGATPEIKLREIRARRGRRERLRSFKGEEDGDEGVKRLARRILIANLKKQKELELDQKRMEDGKIGNGKMKHNPMEVIKHATLNHAKKTGAFAPGFRLPGQEEGGKEEVDDQVKSSEDKLGLESPSKLNESTSHIDGKEKGGNNNDEDKDEEVLILSESEDYLKRLNPKQRRENNDWDKALNAVDKHRDDSEEYSNANSSDASSSSSVDIPEDAKDLDIKTLANLPSKSRVDVIENAKRQQRMNSRREFMSVAANPISYSQCQLKNFLKSADLNRKVNEMGRIVSQKCDGGGDGGFLKGERIASDGSKRFIFTKNVESDDSEFEDNSYVGEVGGRLSSASRLGELKRLRRKRPLRDAQTPNVSLGDGGGMVATTASADVFSSDECSGGFLRDDDSSEEPNHHRQNHGIVGRNRIIDLESSDDDKPSKMTPHNARDEIIELRSDSDSSSNSGGGFIPNDNNGMEKIRTAPMNSRSFPRPVVLLDASDSDSEGGGGFVRDESVDTENEDASPMDIIEASSRHTAPCSESFEGESDDDIEWEDGDGVDNDTSDITILKRKRTSSFGSSTVGPNSPQQRVKTFALDNFDNIEEDDIIEIASDDVSMEGVTEPECEDNGVQQVASANEIISMVRLQPKDEEIFLVDGIGDTMNHASPTRDKSAGRNGDQIEWEGNCDVDRSNTCGTNKVDDCSKSVESKVVGAEWEEDGKDMMTQGRQKLDIGSIYENKAEVDDESNDDNIGWEDGDDSEQELDIEKSIEKCEYGTMSDESCSEVLFVRNRRNCVDTENETKISHSSSTDMKCNEGSFKQRNNENDANTAALKNAQATAAHLTDWAGRAVQRAVKAHLGEQSHSNLYKEEASQVQHEDAINSDEIVIENANISKEQDQTKEVTKGTHDIIDTSLDGLRNEDYLLRQEENRRERDMDTVTDEMVEDVMLLLQLFGLPYLRAPAEAEAQCVELEKLGLVDGVVTEDSDAVVFGSNSVYRNIFDDKRYVEVYLSKDSEAIGLGLNEKIALAMLLGGDYTSGVKGVGIVNGMEILKAFPVTDGVEKGLTTFKEWLDGFDLGPQEDEDSNLAEFKKKHKCARSRWVVPKDFPAANVLQAYSKPVVDSSREKFSWGEPDVDTLRTFCLKKMGWEASETDRAILPVLNEMKNRSRQTRLDGYFMRLEDNIKFADVKSKRLKEAWNLKAEKDIGKNKDRHQDTT